jgi:hypothetical protein
MQSNSATKWCAVSTQDSPDLAQQTAKANGVALMSMCVVQLQPLF